MIEVLKAPPFATVQDLGWRTGRAMGLPQCGAMDRALLQEANECAGNAPGAAALEWALGPGSLRFERDATLCVLEDAEVRIDGVAHGRGAMRVSAGTVVEIIPGRRDRFVYVAIGGGIDVPLTLGSRSTYLPGGFGGVEGRRIKTGDRLPIGAAQGVIARPQRVSPKGGVIARPQRGRGDLRLGDIGQLPI
jgi:allophanate hydrolase subunit 2